MIKVEVKSGLSNIPNFTGNLYMVDILLVFY